jgi:predicted kinase
MSNLNSVISLIRNSKITLFILCGYPYAGKSYIAKQLIEQTDLAYVSIDEIFNLHEFDWNSNNLPDTEGWEQIFAESYNQTKRALTNGNSVLYDSTNQALASRDKLREVANSVGAKAKVVFIKTPVEIVWQRWEENQKDLTRSVVSKNLIQQTIDVFKEPSEDENVIIINN